jgi:hypothetical protein
MSTATTHDAPTELAILRKYATGAELAQIAKDLAVRSDQVADVVQSVNYQRGRAAELVRQREAALAQTRKPLAAPPPAKSVPRRETPRTSGQALVAPDVVREPAPAGEVAAAPVATGVAAINPDALTVLELLDQAAEIPRLAGRVAKVRAAIDDLRGELAEASRVAAAERRVDELRAALAAAADELRRLTRPGAPAKDGPDPKAVRTWAARNGVACTPTGRVPKAVIAQYLAAQ